VRKVDIAAGVIFIIFGVFVLTRSLPLNFYAEGVPGPGFFPTLLAIAMAVTGGLLGVVLAVNVVGFLVAMVLLVAALMLGIERRRGPAAIATIVLTPVLAYLLFAVLLQVPLPTGLFGD
jgi:putative tricarboxylic transport membrane protein